MNKMGAAQSSNVANAVSNVANYVSQSTTANDTQTQSLSESVKFIDCTVQISKDLNVKESAQFSVTNTQISQATQDTNLLNNIQQQMLQNAASEVGFLGIGYADASNSASEFVNDTNQIVQDMNEGASQGSFVSQDFTCERSYISAQNLDIDLSSSTDFLSQQTLNQQQTAKIVNDISQTVTQKASATVQGISGLILLLLLLLAVIIYGLTKPLSSGSVKIIVGVIVVFIVAGIMTWMYLKSCPPFFGSTNECIYGSSIGGCTDQCINMEASQISLKNTPFRYIYGLMPGDISTPGGNLVQMAIAASNPGQTAGGAGNNGGYTMDTCNNLQARINTYASYAASLGIDNVPNPLTNFTDEKPSNGASYWQIPTEFMIGGNNSCTPQILQLAVGAQGNISECVSYSPGDQRTNTIVDPQTQGMTGTNDPSLAVANFNISAWNTYLQNDPQNVKAKFARFVLCDIIGNIDLHLYMQDDELVKYVDPNNNPVVGPAKNYPTYTYLYNPSASTISYRDGMTGGGVIHGSVGVCNNKTYKFQTFMKKVGIWILVGLLIVAFGWMFYTWYRGKGKSAPSAVPSRPSAAPTRPQPRASVPPEKASNEPKLSSQPSLPEKPSVASSHTSAAELPFDLSVLNS